MHGLLEGKIAGRGQAFNANDSLTGQEIQRNLTPGGLFLRNICVIILTAMAPAQEMSPGRENIRLASLSSSDL